MHHDNKVTNDSSSSPIAAAVALNRFLRLKRGDIALLQFILEGYEGLVTVTTEDAEAATVRLSIMTDFQEDVDTILLNLRNSFHFEEIHHSGQPCHEEKP